MLDKYLTGSKLYGEDLSETEIAAWYEDEKQGYADLGAGKLGSYSYVYHALNTRHGFRWLPIQSFEHVLGIGSAYGDEFLPIADRIHRLTIVEPSDNFFSTQVHGIPTTYKAPSPDGVLDLPSASFDLTIVLGVLHHIPVVSQSIREMYRCTIPGGFALIREPIVSMGDWRKPRPGLTKRERGIPLEILQQFVKQAGFEVLKETLCVFAPIPKLCKLCRVAPYNNRTITRVDAWISRAMRWNLEYHATTWFNKLRPVSVYLVMRKPASR